MSFPENAALAPRLRMPASERRLQLATAAAARFHQLGYHRVSLADVAADVGVTAPAVSRHFGNKQGLLTAAIASGLDLVQEAVADPAARSLDEVVTGVAEVGLERPDLWVLLQRESRFLDPQSEAAILGQLGEVTQALVRRMRRERPALVPDDARLLVAAAEAVLSTPSVTRKRLPRAVYRAELVGATMAALRVEFPVGPAGADRAEPAGAPARTAPSRSDEVVDHAVDLFFRRGYNAVSLDDIGASLGIAGPSLYHHFPTKADILIAAFDRATSRLAEDRRRRDSDAAPPELAELIASYTAFCLQNRTLAGVYVTEAIHLPPKAQRELDAVMRDGVAEWTAALLAADSRLDEPVARVRVHAAQVAIHDLVRLGHFYRRPRIAAEIAAIAQAVLIQEP